MNLQSNKKKKTAPFVQVLQSLFFESNPRGKYASGRIILYFIMIFHTLIIIMSGL